MPASAGVQGPGDSTRLAGAQPVNALQRDLVVAEDPHLLPELGEVLHQVVGEAVVVVDHQQHDQNPSSTSSAARISARALASVSFHSSSGTESATTPAARLHVEHAVLDDAGADGDCHVHVAGEAQVATGAAVDAALDGFELVDDLHRAHLRRTCQRAGREGRRAARRGWSCRARASAFDVANDVHHVRVALDGKRSVTFTVPVLAMRPMSFLAQVDQHHMLGALLRIAGSSASRPGPARAWRHAARTSERRYVTLSPSLVCS